MCASFQGPKFIAGGWYDSLKYEINEIQPQELVQLDISQLLSKTMKSTSLSQLHRKYSPDRILSLRSVSGGVLSASEGGVSIDTNNGRLLISLKDYIDRIKLDRPKFVIAMADEVPYSVGKKRLSVAVRRTQLWYTQLRESADIDWNTSSLIGVVIGKNNDNFQESVISQTQFLLSNGARGLLVGGIGLGESLDERRNIIKLIQEVRGDNDCPLFIQGIQTLEEILHAISCGIDYISTDYPAILTRSGHILNVNLSFLDAKDESHISDSPTKKQKVRREPSTAMIDDSLEILNIWDPIYSRDVSSLGVNCSCHACRNYSRAYIHHLVVCHELLGEAMIYTHNFHSTALLFQSYR